MKVKWHEDIECSFCGLPKGKMVSNMGSNICESCLELAKKSLCGAIAPEAARGIKQNLLTPKEMKAELDKFVIKQDHAKKILAIAVYEHFRRITSKGAESVINVNKSNVLLIGPTGSGKTHLARALALILKAPFYMHNATGITEAGYVGEDVEHIIKGFLKQENGDVARVERGIIYIDEIDKKAAKPSSSSRDVSGKGVQQALLTMIEGTTVNVPRSSEEKKDGGNKPKVTVDTRNILFILGGRFGGLDRIVKTRLNGGRPLSEKPPLGFGNDQHKEYNRLCSMSIGEALGEVTPDDFEKFGMIPEFNGRIPVVAALDELSVDDLVRVATEPKENLMSLMQRNFSPAKMVFSDEAMRVMAEMAYATKTGGRGLRRILEKVTQEARFEQPPFDGVEKVYYDADTVRERKKALVVHKEKKEKSSERDWEPQVCTGVA